MKHIGSLFEKYKKNIKPPQASIEKVCIEVIQEVAGFTLESTALTYTPATKTLSIKAPSIVKQEIKLHSGEILKKLSIKLGSKGVPKIIL